MKVEINAMERFDDYGSSYRPVTIIIDTDAMTLTVGGAWGKTFALTEVKDVEDGL